MRHELVYTSTFVRASRRMLSRHPDVVGEFQVTLATLAANPFHPSLRTHKPRGRLKECFACSAGYDLRIIFRFVTAGGKKAVFLQTVGTHDEVY